MWLFTVFGRFDGSHKDPPQKRDDLQKKRCYLHTVMKNDMNKWITMEERDKDDA